MTKMTDTAATAAIGAATRELRLTHTGQIEKIK